MIVGQKLVAAYCMVGAAGQILEPVQMQKVAQMLVFAQKQKSDWVH